MARKKKVEIVDQELTPTVLFTKKEKKGSVIWLVFIFAIFIAVVIYLPDIAAYMEQYLNPEVATPINPGNVDDGEDNNTGDEEEEVIEYELVAGLQITEGQLVLSNFEVANNQISFDITNNSSELVDFTDLHYFLNLYNANRMLLQRIMLTDEVVAAGGTISLVYDLNDSNIHTLSFAEIMEDEYPSHVMPVDGNGNAVLTCTKGYETVNYNLTNNVLYSIEDVFTVPSSDANYSTLYSSYQALAATYNTIGGVDSTVTVENNTLYFRTNLNLSTVSEGSFNSIIYYPINTDAKVMNFELEANGYTCN